MISLGLGTWRCWQKHSGSLWVPFSGMYQESAEWLSCTLDLSNFEISVSPLHLSYFSLCLKWKWINYLDFICLFMLFLHLINFCVGAYCVYEGHTVFMKGIQRTTLVLWDRDPVLLATVHQVNCQGIILPLFIEVLRMPTESNSGPQSLHSKCLIHWAKSPTLYLILRCSLNLEWCLSLSV